jgi:hypothetical protein
VLLKDGPEVQNFLPIGMGDVGAELAKVIVAARLVLLGLVDTAPTLLERLLVVCQVTRHLFPPPSVGPNAQVQQRAGQEWRGAALRRYARGVRCSGLFGSAFLTGRTVAGIGHGPSLTDQRHSFRSPRPLQQCGTPPEADGAKPPAKRAMAGGHEGY